MMKMLNIFYLLTNQLQYLVAQPSTAWRLAFWDIFPNILGFLVRDGDPVKLDENDEDPITYMDAMQRSDSDKWFEAMRSEIKSMKINDVWTLVDPPERIKPIGCKWIFKRKRGADEKVEIYKVCLVAKEYC